jgi:hypothetical protein
VALRPCEEGEGHSILHYRITLLVALLYKPCFSRAHLHINHHRTRIVHCTSKELKDTQELHASTGLFWDIFAEDRFPF